MRRVSAVDGTLFLRPPGKHDKPVAQMRKAAFDRVAAARFNEEAVAVGEIPSRRMLSHAQSASLARRSLHSAPLQEHERLAF